MTILNRLGWCAAVLALIIAVAGCGGTRPSQTEAALMEADAKAAEATNTLRRDSMERLVQRLRPQQEEFVAGRSKTPATIHILSLSGGGDYGAFGAGFLRGWGKVTDPEMRRPTFDVVMGVSTGALIAPFAFIGEDADYDRIVELYRNPKKDWVRERGLLFFLPYNVSFAEVPGLERELREAVGKDKIARMADGAAEGRLLGVNTTDLDFGASRPWDLGLESQRAVRTGEYERVYQMLLASAGIPGAFPPRDIDGGLYVDGGVTSNIIYGGALKRDQDFNATWRRLCPDLPCPRMRYWVVMNNQVQTPPKVVSPRWPAVIGRSVETAIRASTVTSLRHLATMVELMKLRDGTDVELRIIAIPDSWRGPKEGVFIKETMENLADLGEKMGADPNSWLKECP